MLSVKQREIKTTGRKEEGSKQKNRKVQVDDSDERKTISYRHEDPVIANQVVSLVIPSPRVRTCARRTGKLAEVCFNNTRKYHAATGPAERAMEKAIHVDHALRTFVASVGAHRIRFAAKCGGRCAARCK